MRAKRALMVPHKMRHLAPLAQVKPMPLPQTETPGALQTELLSRGIRKTRQRRIVLEIIETANW